MNDDRPSATHQASGLPPGRRRSLLGLILVAALTLAGETTLAQGSPSPSAAPAAATGRTVRVLTHESFLLPDDLLASFEETTGARLEILKAEDAGSMVNQAILTAGDPLADALYGVDDTFLSRALEADIFVPYVSPELSAVPDAFELDPQHRVTPVDVGEVCLNLDRAAFGDGGLPIPASLEDLTRPELRGTLVVENPATSSPGLAFLLATIVRFGDEEPGGWRDFWRALRANDTLITRGWNDAYYGHFSGGSGKGDRPIVVSYATSPVAEVVFAPEPTPLEAPTAVLEDGCFRQIEFAGVLRGAAEPELAGAVVDFMVSPDVQAAIPLSMFVRPVRDDVALPEPFVVHGVVPEAPLTMDPAAIAAGREAWIAEWTDIMLR
jgi:thiamine transport system substrate-binding protein